MTTTKPAIAWVGASAANYETGRGGLRFEAVVLHIAGGAMAGIDAWFNDARARASAHFAVGRDGRIHQYVQLTDRAFAHGVIEQGYTARLIDANRRADGTPLNPNDWAVGIEHEGRSGDVVTPAQWSASTRLCAWLFASEILPHASATGATIDRDHVLRHADISPQTRAHCPGWSEALIARYIREVADLVRPPAPADDRAQLVAELRGIVAAADDDALRAAVRRQGAIDKLAALGVTL